MSKKYPDPYRLQVTHNLSGKDQLSYIVRKDDGKVIYISGSEQPLALSNLVGDRAALVRFALQDCEDGFAATDIVVMELVELWGDTPNRPQVKEI